jgi:hypothetical protein
MNLRDIKKDIEYVLSAFVDDCYFLATCNPSVSDEGLSNLLDEAVELFNDLKDKVNVKPEGSKKAYFNGLRKELLEKTDALYTKLSDVVKASKK